MSEPAVDPTPKQAWMVTSYVPSHGWSAVASCEVCRDLDGAVAYAKRCAIAHPGVSYVVFEATSAWRTAPGEPIEEQLL